MLEVGAVLQNRYRIIRQRGVFKGIASYRAVDQVLSSTVILREVPVELDEIQLAYERGLLGALNHPALPRVFDLFMESGTLYITVRFPPGRDVINVMKEQGGLLPVEDVLTWGVKILEALNYLATQKVPPLDMHITPDTLRLTKTGKIALLNVGITRATLLRVKPEGLASSSEPVSPYEALEGINLQTVDERSYIYSIAATQYYLLTGAPPIDAVTRAEAVARGQSDPLTPAHVVNPNIPESVGIVLKRALAINASHRWADASRMRTALRKALGEIQKAREVEATESAKVEGKLSESMSGPAASVFPETIRDASKRLQLESADTEEQPERPTGHVLCMDIVGFSRQSMPEQSRSANELQQIVKVTHEFHEAAGKEQVTTVGTGDGLVLVFFNEMLAPVRCALEISRTLKEASQIKVRMGIDSGEVYRMTGVLADSRISGSCINQANRLMDSGEVGHILLSESVGRALKEIEGWSDFVFDLGEYEVKHGLKVHAYNLYTEDAGNPTIPIRFRDAIGPSRGQQQRSAPEVSRDNESSRLRHALENKLPYPLASLFYQLSRTDDWRAQITEIAGLVEVSMEHLTIIGIAEYLSQDKRDAKLNERLTEVLRRAPTIGTWAGLLRDIHDCLRQASASVFTSELMTYYPADSATQASASLQQLGDQLVALRNKLQHSPGTKPSRDQHQEFKHLLLEFLQLLSFLKDYPLVSVSSTESHHDIKSHVCNLHMGFHETSEQVSVQCDLDLAKTRVAMLNPRVGELLYLHPFYVFRECPECRVAHFFRFEKLAKNGISYTATGGHKLKDESGALELRAMISEPWSTKLRQKAKYLFLEFDDSWHKLSAGQRVDGKYQIVEWLRRGGMADIYGVTRVGTSDQLALKLLPFQFLSDQKMVQRFRLEAMQARNFDHPNITRIFDYGEDLVDHYLVMELANGWKATDGIVALDIGELPKPLDEAKAIEIIKQACEGLDYIHQQQVIHRDIKPGNLLLFDGGIVKLADFGIARSRESITLTMTGLAVGTPEYMSPEQAEGKRGLTPATDIYALGVVFYELLVGEPPFKRTTPLATAVAHLREEVPDPKKINPKISDRLRAIVLKCLEKEPKRRFGSARALYQAISEYEAEGDRPAESVSTKLYVRCVSNRLTGHEGSVNSVSFFPDGLSLASGGADATLRLWDVATGSLTQTIKAHELEVSSVAISTDGSKVMTGSYDRMVKLWDIRTGELVRTLIWQRNPTVDAVAFSPDGSLAASGGEVREPRRNERELVERAGEINIWETEYMKLRHTLTGHGFTVTSLAFSPHDKYLVSGSWDKTVKIWNAEDGKLLRSLSGHEGAIYSVAVSPDGASIATSSEDQTVRLWDMESGELRRTLRGHSVRVLSVAYSPDGLTLASASGEHQKWGEIKVWDVESGVVKQTLRGDSAVMSVAFSPDSSLLVGGSSDGTIRIWDLEKVTSRGPQGVLWVENNQTLNSFIVDKMRNDGVSVVQAMSTAEAVSMLISSTNKVDIIVSALGWNDDDEYRAGADIELIEAVRGAGIAVPIYAYSASYAEQDRARILAVGGSGITTSPQKLVEIIMLSATNSEGAG